MALTSLQGGGPSELPLNPSFDTKQVLPAVFNTWHAFVQEELAACRKKLPHLHLFSELTQPRCPMAPRPALHLHGHRSAPDYGAACTSVTTMAPSCFSAWNLTLSPT